MSDIFASNNCEMQTNRAYEIKPKTVLVEDNAQTNDQTNFCGIKMQRCDAYKVENNSVTMEQIAAYGIQQSQASSVENHSCIVENDSLL